MAKLLATTIFVITVVSFNRYALERLIPFILYPALLMALSQTPYALLFKRFLLALPFCLFAGLSNVIFDRTAFFAIGSITVTGGVISLFTILLKTYLCVMAVLILVSVTPLSRLTSEMRQLRIPGIFITMFELTYRYIGVLLNEAYNMTIAYSLRSCGRKGIKMKDMGSFAGQLLIRSFDRADRVYNAMKCRGYACIENNAAQNMAQNSRGPVLKDIAFFVIIFLLCITFRFVDVNALFALFLERFIIC
jgi:cobalt/nickel transport system permease protein